METYRTMTVSGSYGSSFQAGPSSELASWEDAERQAVAAGYKVLDWTDSGGENILVIAE